MKPRGFVRALGVLVLIVAALAGAIAGATWWWSQRPLVLAEDTVEFYLPPGTGVRASAQKMVAAGIETNARWLEAYFRAAGYGRTIKAGEYALDRGASPQQLLDKLLRGDRVVRSVTLIEGWTFAQVRQALANAAFLKHDTTDLTDAAIMAELGRPGVAPEGRFFPDTYHYLRDSTELALLRQAMREMDQRLEVAWAERAPGLPLESADEALILASIVEKETGLAADRPEVAGVFINRLKKGMPLQTDPTVIYGLGERYDGKLRRSDLRADTPFNTYVRNGLPPTPIAIPGKAALMAAVRPAQTSALYFVARGDGSSQFSESLGEHNRAVDRYQRGTAAAKP